MPIGSEIIAAVRDSMARRLSDYFAGKDASSGERRWRLESKLRSLESQGKFCPPEALKKLRREIESLK